MPINASLSVIFDIVYFAFVGYMSCDGIKLVFGVSDQV